MRTADANSPETVAVAVAFFLCWAPFHVQRLMAVYGKSMQQTSELYRTIYWWVTYVSGVMYYLSTCVNPLLYSVMSHKFRNAFKVSGDDVFSLFLQCAKLTWTNLERILLTSDELN